MRASVCGRACEWVGECACTPRPLGCPPRGRRRLRRPGPPLSGRVRRKNYLSSTPVPEIVPSVAPQPAAECSFHHPATKPGAKDRPAPEQTPPPHAARNDTQSAEKSSRRVETPAKEATTKSLSFPLSSTTRPWRRGGGVGGEEAKVCLPLRCLASSTPRG